MKRLHLNLLHVSTYAYKPCSTIALRQAYDWENLTAIFLPKTDFGTILTKKNADFSIYA